MNPIVIAFTTHREYPGVLRLEESCRRWGWALDVVEHPWAGWGGRLKIVAARATTWQATHTHVLHVDAWDVVATGPPADLGPALFAHGKPPMLFATEMACWPPDVDASIYPPRTTPWWYAHSQWCWDLSQALPAGFLDLADSEDDQRHFHHLIAQQTPGIVLDRSCRVFQSLAHGHPHEHFFARSGNRWVNTMLGTKPLFMHGNGQTEMTWVTDGV